MSSVSTATTTVSITEITTGEPTLPLLLRLQNHPSQVIEKMGSLLSTILEKHQNDKDALSLKLRTWAEERMAQQDATITSVLQRCDAQQRALEAAQATPSSAKVKLCVIQ